MTVMTGEFQAGTLLLRTRTFGDPIILLLVRERASAFRGGSSVGVVSGPDGYDVWDAWSFRASRQPFFLQGLSKGYVATRYRLLSEPP